MKPTRECDQSEKMLRALLILDALALYYEQNPEEISGFVHDIYVIAHAAHGQCSCKTGFDRIDEKARLLKEVGIMNLEKILNEANRNDLLKYHPLPNLECLSVKRM